MNERIFNKTIDKLRTPERLERLEVDRVIRYIADGKTNSILDIGTGTGLFAEAFHKNNLKTTGIDINVEMINAAKTYLPECDFFLAPAEALPLENNSYDVAFFGLVLHEADDYLKALQEARRVVTHSVWVLEWYYKNEEFGPPIEHRLNKEFIENLAGEAGFTNFEEIPLDNLVLYRLS